jgi:hypothetical protein
VELVIEIYRNLAHKLFCVTKHDCQSWVSVVITECYVLFTDKLSCVEHKCEEPCHRGNCPPCWRVSFEELRCHCGAEVIYPPVPCGTRAPACNRPCTRGMPCGHEVQYFIQVVLAFYFSSLMC